MNNLFKENDLELDTIDENISISHVLLLLLILLLLFS